MVCLSSDARIDITSQGSGLSSFRVAPLFYSPSRIRGIRKPLFVFSVEVVVITLVGTRREAKRLRVSSAMCRLLEVHYVSTERLLAALQIPVGVFLPAVTF